MRKIFFLCQKQFVFEVTDQNDKIILAGISDEERLKKKKIRQEISLKILYRNSWLEAIVLAKKKTVERTAVGGPIIAIVPNLQASNSNGRASEAVNLSGSTNH